MRTIIRRYLGLGVAVLAMTAGLAKAQEPNTLTPTEKKAGWQLLFNGHNLDGWQARATSVPTQTGDWSVKDGAISCPGTSSGWLSTDATFSDFELTLQFRGSEKVNSGVFLRSKKEGQPHITGYEMQIWDYQPGGYNTGSLVGSIKATPTKINGDKWNTYLVTANDGHYVVVLNGKTILDGRDTKHLSGVIGLQCQKGNNIEFRNIKVMPLER